MTVENIEKLARAIAREEGFFDPIGPDGPNRPQRNHNPGDLKGWPNFPADAEGFSDFGDDLTGWEKLHIDVMVHGNGHPAQTLAEFIGGDDRGWPGYAPASDHNDPAAYAAALGAAVGGTAQTTFAEL